MKQLSKSESCERVDFGNSGCEMHVFFISDGTSVIKQVEQILPVEAFFAAGKFLFRRIGGLGDGGIWIISINGMHTMFADVNSNVTAGSAVGVFFKRTAPLLK